MSKKVIDAEALFARRIERSGDHRRMVIARRGVVERARVHVLLPIVPTNDGTSDAD
jgi:hypothetical protein